LETRDAELAGGGRSDHPKIHAEQATATTDLWHPINQKLKKKFEVVDVGVVRVFIPNLFLLKGVHPPNKKPKEKKTANLQLSAS